MGLAGAAALLSCLLPASMLLAQQGGTAASQSAPKNKTVDISSRPDRDFLLWGSGSESVRGLMAWVDSVVKPCPPEKHPGFAACWKANEDRFRKVRGKLLLFDHFPLTRQVNAEFSFVREDPRPLKFWLELAVELPTREQDGATWLYSVAMDKPSPGIRDDKFGLRAPRRQFAIGPFDAVTNQNLELMLPHTMPYVDLLAVPDTLYRIPHPFRPRTWYVGVQFRVAGIRVRSHKSPMWAEIYDAMGVPVVKPRPKPE
ncbi:MAG: hypothetical protein GMKNLPBB_00725 [Myxococcota bacterium]|nr:hypothetical protein [Myxococcota bacterium]